MTFRLALVALVALLGSRVARAEEPPPVAEFTQDTRGVMLHATYVLGTFGKALPALVNFQWAGIRSFQERKGLFTFDAAGGFEGGYGGNSHPTFLFYGANVRGQGEVGVRLAAHREVSPYVGGTGLFDGSAVAITTADIGHYDTVNPVDGLAGLNGVLGLRVNGGLSVLHENHALLVTVFAEESLRRPGSPLSGPLFTSFGARAQFDIVRSFTAALEGAWGATFGRVDPTTGFTNSASRFELKASVRKLLGPVWLGLDGQLHGTGNVATGVTTYVTSPPAYASAGLTFGVSL